MKPEEDEEFQSAMRDYEVFAAERKILIAAEAKHSASFDKYLLTFSAGTFGLTVAFVKDMVATIKPETKWILSAAWSILIATILLVLISFLTSQAAYRKQIEIDKELLVTKRGKISYKKNRWAGLTIGLDLSAISAFVAGIILLTIFATKNL
jgi:hypothetical protein